MTEEDKNTLDKIKQLSNSILLIATENDKLEEIKELEKTRADFIENFCSKPVQAEDSNEVAKIIKYVIEVNEQITIILEKNKKLISTELKKFKTSKKATNAYLSNL
jgi:hypothetical protein